MKSLLKDMFYQRFSLKNDSVKHQKQLREVSSLIERNEEDLKARLNTDEQEVFEKYLDCTNEIRSLECCCRLPARRTHCHGNHLWCG